MSEIDVKEIYKKHAPSNSKLFFRVGVILLVFWVGGIIYGQFFMDIPDEMNPEQTNDFRLGIGFGIGLYLSAVPTLLLCIHHVFKIFEAKKLTEEELLKLSLNKIKNKT